MQSVILIGPHDQPGFPHRAVEHYFYASIICAILLPSLKVQVDSYLYPNASWQQTKYIFGQNCAV